MIIDPNLPVDVVTEKRDRNFYIQILCPLESNGNYTIRCNREVVLVDKATGKRVDTGGDQGEKRYAIEKELSEIASDSVTVDGVTLTGAQIAAFVEALSDLYADVPQSSLGA